MKKVLLLSLIITASQVLFAQLIAEKNELVEKVVVSSDDTVHMQFLRDSSLYTEGWDTLAQPKFWQQVICMTGDTCIINIAASRIPLEKVSRYVWKNQNENDKTLFKDSINCVYELDAGTELYVTAGKGEFYELKKALPDISEAIQVFLENHTDPFYAQAILLIESPGKAKTKSYVGANGPFQLMRSVAKKFGLTVTKYRDDRSDLRKSAVAAARLLRTSCIPYVKSYLDEQHLAYTETDLWFRLLVLHAYHAGAMNVGCVIRAIKPDEGGIELFKKLWFTECGGFKNESQNYSQIALASLLNLDKVLEESGDTVFLVKGNKMLAGYNRLMNPVEAFGYLNKTLNAYERDLTDGTVSFDYFMKKAGVLRKEFSLLADEVLKKTIPLSINQYPATEEHVDSVGHALLRHQRFEEAIKLFRLNVEMHPKSVTAIASLAKAYFQSGNKQLAALYTNRSEMMIKKEELRTD